MSEKFGLWKFVNNIKIIYVKVSFVVGFGILKFFFLYFRLFFLRWEMFQVGLEDTMKSFNLHKWMF